jgi:hypothetical protein
VQLLPIDFAAKRCQQTSDSPHEEKMTASTQYTLRQSLALLH